MKTSFWLISFIAFEAFKISNFFTINCRFRYSSIPYGVGSFYSCLATNIPESSGSYVTEITGEHTEEKNAEFINIYGNRTLSFFPKNFSHFFPNLTGIVLTETSFKKLYGDELNEYGENFKYFSLTNSNLESISNGLFTNTPNIIIIIFNSNKILYVGDNLFNPLNLSKMIYLDFSGNRCHSRMQNGAHDIPNLVNEIFRYCGFDDAETTTTIRTTTQKSYCLSYDRKTRKVVKNCKFND
ncbi:hypothetical protein PVAND_017758 [Polypedilum vanderplanki]|uniref:Uncharacterized protein n=1 Tax=Polypedilum vanderplanki TaxID=319348 RepID=A0A9J6B8H4_POLVA|nr:hypothetical protein PVAND_017758 [Polypedilum vanderplanki]